MPTISPTVGLNRSIIESRQQLTDMQKQLATGKKVDTYGALGLQRNQMLSMRSELSQIKGYTDSIKILDVRLDVMLQSLEHVSSLATESKSDALEVGFEPDSNGRTVLQTQLGARLDEVLSLLNNEVNGRHLFGGRATEENPVLSTSEILDGAGGRAGFRQVVDERRQADLGADGLGRLVLDGPQASVLGAAVGTPGDIGGAATAEFTVDIGGNTQTFDVSDGGFDTLADLEAGIDAAFGADVASIVNGDQLQITAQNVTDTITITDVDAGASTLAGLTHGTVANPSAATSITEDSATSPFGFKLAAASSTLTGTTVTGPAGSPASLDVTFTGTLPNDGETLRVTFDLPDGTEKDLVLTARENGPVEEGEFLIGVDENETAANLQTALSSAIGTDAEKSLSAASLFAAADNFFDIDEGSPPQRVDGPPFDTATTLVDATGADTVFWYQGEVSSTDARQSTLVKVDDNISVSAGARANEESLVQVVKTFAAVAVEEFDETDSNAAKRYAEMRHRASAELTFPDGMQSVDEMVTELTISKTTAGRSTAMHKASDALIRDTVGNLENADVYEVSAQILSLQTRLQASFQVVANISRLSIVNYI